MFFAFFSLIPLLIGVLLVVAGIRAVLAAVKLPRRVPREAACGRCGYAVAGLASPVCPECGSDFRVVGISTPSFVMRWRGSYFGAIVGWSLVMLVMGMVSWTIFSLFLLSPTFVAAAGGGGNWSSSVSEKLTPITKNGYTFELSSGQSWGQGGAATQTVTLTASLPDGTAQEFELDIVNQRYTFEGDDGQEVLANYDGRSVDRWLTRIGYADPTDETRVDEVRDLGRFVDAAAVSPGGPVTFYGQNTFTVGVAQWSNTNTTTATGAAAPSTDTLTIIGFSVAGVLFLIWVGGVVWICLRRSKLLAMGDPTNRSTPARSPLST